LYKMKITLSVTLLASLVAFAFASSLADVLADIENGLNQVTALHKTIAALPDKGGSLLSAFVRLVHVVPVDLPLMLPLSMQPLISGGISIVTALNKKTTGVNVSFFPPLLIGLPQFFEYDILEFTKAAIRG